MATFASALVYKLLGLNDSMEMPLSLLTSLDGRVRRLASLGLG